MKGKKIAKLHNKKQPGLFKEQATTASFVPRLRCQLVFLFLYM